MSKTGLEDLRVCADYQFGAGAGVALFPPDREQTIRRSSGGRPRQIIAGDVDETPGNPEGDRIVSYGTDGRFTLGITGGKRLHKEFSAPVWRITVGTESEPYVKDGRNAFAKFVTNADYSIRPGDEVLVVGKDDTLFGVGRANLAGAEALAFGAGVAVAIREGIS